MSYDRLISFLAGLGVPGVILIVAIAVGGYAGGAAIVFALAVLGGPLGMLGGLALLGVIALICAAVTTPKLTRSTSS